MFANFDDQKLDSYFERQRMTTSVPHQGFTAWLGGFVINDIILIKIGHCVWYLEMYCDNFKACYTIKFFVIFGYFTLELLILITVWSSFCNTCGFCPKNLLDFALCPN